MALHLSEEQAARLLGKAAKRKPKYGNVRCESGGIAFASHKERNYYHQLLLRKIAREVSEIKLHPRYAITIKGVHVCYVVLDFEFLEIRTNKRRYIDVKGKDNALSALKRKMLEAQHGITVELA